MQTNCIINKVWSRDIDMNRDDAHPFINNDLCLNQQKMIEKKCGKFIDNGA